MPMFWPKSYAKRKLTLNPLLMSASPVPPSSPAWAGTNPLGSASPHWSALSKKPSRSPHIRPRHCLSLLSSSLTWPRLKLKHQKPARTTSASVTCRQTLRGELQPSKATTNASSRNSTNIAGWHSKPASAMQPKPRSYAPNSTRPNLNSPPRKTRAFGKIRTGAAARAG